MSGSTTAIIQGYYTTVLNRTGSTAEIAGWANLVANGSVTLAQVQSDIVNSFEALNNVAPIVEMYQAELGRVPDQAGLAFWVGKEDSGALTLAQISAAITGSAESQAFYGVTTGVATSASITQMYVNILGRQPEPNAVTSWLGAGMTEAAIQQAIAGSPEAMARATPAVSTFLTSAAQGNPSAYTGSLFSGASGTPGATFTLTTGVDAGAAFTGGPNATFIGTVGITAAATTLNAGDSLTGTGVGNTLKIIDTSGAAANDLTGVGLTGIQTVSVQNASTAGIAAIDLTLFPSVANVIALNTVGGDTDTFTGLATGATVVASGAGTGAGTVAGTTTVTFSEKTATDAVSVGVDGGANGVTFTDLAAPTAATISSTGAANGKGTTAATGIDTFALTASAGSLKTLAVKATTNLVAALTATDYAATAALTVTGAASSVTLANATPFKTVDASGLTAGGLTLTTGAVLTSLTGGAGNDVITIGVVPTGAATINLGAGNNKLLGTAALLSTATINGGTGGFNTVSSALINAGNANKFTNFQDLSLQSSAPLDTSLVLGITALSIDALGGGTTYSNVATTQGLTDTFFGDNSGAANVLNFTGLSGTANAYSITFAGAAQTAVATAANVKMGSVAETGINNLTVASGGGANTWNSLALGADLTANTVAITGAQNLDLTFAGFGAISSTTGQTGVSLINGSAATGKLNINLAGVTAATAGIAVKGGTGADTITTSAGASTLTGGGGADTFIIGATTMGTTSTSTNFTTINDPILTDKITFLAPVATDSGFITAAVNVGAATTLAGALDLAAAAAGTTPTTYKADWFSFGGSDYVVQHSGAGAAIGATDVVAKLAGVGSTLSLATATYDTTLHTLTLA
jgi:hypothetical protein